MRNMIEYDEIVELFGEKISSICDSRCEYYIREVNPISEYNITKRIPWDYTDDFVVAVDAEWNTKKLDGTFDDQLVTCTFSTRIYGRIYAITSINSSGDKCVVSLCKVLDYLNKRFNLNLAVYREKTKDDKHIPLDFLKKKFKNKRPVKLIGFFNGVDLRWLDIFISFSGYDQIYCNGKHFLVIRKACAITLHNVKLQCKTFVNWKEYESVTNLSLEDVMLLLAPKTSLNKACTDFLGASKVDLTKYEKSHMLELFQTNLKRYEEYATKDSVLTLMLWHVVRDAHGFEGLTVPQIVANRFLHFVGCRGEDFDRLIKGFQYDKKEKLYKTFDKKNKGLIKHLETLNEVTHFLKGGTNQSFTYTHNLKKPTLDVDLASAYGFSIATIPKFDYTKEFFQLENVKLTDIKNYKEIFNYSKFNQMGYCIVSCTVPDRLISVFQQYTEKNDLIYTSKLEECILTIPELIVLIEHGVTDIYFHKISIPHQEFTKSNEHAEFIKELVLERNKLKLINGKGSAPEQTLKIQCNSFFGKIGQGINPKNVTSFYEDESVILEQNNISDPFVSSYITGFIRAILFICMNYLREKRYTIYSVTTDGFITDCDEEKIQKLNDYLKTIPCVERICKILQIANNLEIKHRQQTLYNIKTRFNFASVDDPEGVLAHVGLKLKEETNMEQKGKLTELIEHKEIHFTSREEGLESLKNLKDKGLKSLNKVQHKQVVLLHDARVMPLEADENGVILRIPRDLEEYKKAKTLYEDLKYYKFALDASNIAECEVYVQRYKIALENRRMEKVKTLMQWYTNEIKIYKNYNHISMFKHCKTKEELLKELNVYAKQAKFAAIKPEVFNKKYRNVKKRDDKVDPWLTEYNTLEFLNKLKSDLNRLRRG